MQSLDGNLMKSNKLMASLKLENQLIDDQSKIEVSSSNYSNYFHSDQQVHSDYSLNAAQHSESDKHLIYLSSLRSANQLTQPICNRNGDRTHSSTNCDRSTNHLTNEQLNYNERFTHPMTNGRPTNLSSEQMNHLNGQHPPNDCESINSNHQLTCLSSSNLKTNESPNDYSSSTNVDQSNQVSSTLDTVHSSQVYYSNTESNLAYRLDFELNDILMQQSQLNPLNSVYLTSTPFTPCTSNHPISFTSSNTASSMTSSTKNSSITSTYFVSPNFLNQHPIPALASQPDLTKVNHSSTAYNDKTFFNSSSFSMKEEILDPTMYYDSECRF